MNNNTPFTQSISLKDIGIENAKIHYQLSANELHEMTIALGQGIEISNGALAINTGEYTGRSPLDRFIVKDSISENQVWWGKVNIPFEPAAFDALYKKVTTYLSNKEVYVRDSYVCADPNYRLNVRVVTETPWANLFCYNMFLRPEPQELENFTPEWTLLCVPSFLADPAVDGTRQSNFAILDFTKKIVLIGGTGYTGEMKKGIFSALNFILPVFKNTLPMHCSANVGKDGDTAIFFGLSGTGKTTLSADPNRKLIGDDEHGWTNENTVFNFEGGCYAKCIGLSESAEPEIFATTKRFGTILENVPFDPITRLIDLDDDSLTENTRASYPLEFINNAMPEKKAGHPKNVILLTCDASGVMPPIARLTPNQALYQFISGYTSKIAGTEVGLRDEPEITFSACFGGPFMVHHPYKYAELLKRKIERYGVTCWLVNTGWVGGPYGVGKRISIKYTRALLNAALNGKLDQVKFAKDPIFGFEVPTKCPDVPDEVLNPASSWGDKKEYDRRYKDLAMRFVQNFAKFTDIAPQEVLDAGPKI